MLVITRKKGERFILDWGDGCAVISIHSIGRGQCRLGIVASKEVGIFREELEKKVRPGSIASSIHFEDHESKKRISIEPIEFA